MSLDRVPVLTGPSQFLEGGYTISSGFNHRSLLRVPEVVRFNSLGATIDTEDYEPGASPPPPPPPLCTKVITLCWSIDLGPIGSSGCNRWYSCWKHFRREDYPDEDPPCPADGKLSYFPDPNPPNVSLSAATCYSTAGPNQCHCTICCVGYPSSSCIDPTSKCTWETPCGVTQPSLASCFDGSNC